MPPLKFADLDTEGIQVDPDNKIVTVRQSWLGTYSDCPERARRGAARIDVDGPNDASALGTAVHFAIEQAVNDQLAGTAATLPQMQAWFFEEWDVLKEYGERGIPLRWVKRSPAQAESYGLDCVQRFHDGVYPHLEPIATEVGFGPLELPHKHNGWTVRIQGSIDYVDKRMGLVDWKTASRTYQAWEKRRWAIQPTVYLAAQALTDGAWAFVPDKFTYVVFPDTKKAADRVQSITVTRSEGQMKWLAAQVATIAETAAALGFDRPWPTRDQHALCSPTWCPSWDGCRGQYLGDEPADWQAVPTPVRLGA